MKKLLHKVFGTRNQRLLKEYKKIVAKVNSLEKGIQSLSDEALKQKTQEFKQRVASGETLSSLLPEAFAVCREASLRVFNIRPYDVQLIGGIVLNDGKIAEMRTGEGKTLTGTLAAYLNALSGGGVHVVTVNEYLAKRDATEMGKLYNFLGLSVGVNLPDMAHEAKQDAYECDITYGTNNEFGFDYLRDNMVFDLGDKVQRGLNFAIVDEVDSILIDEARTPLIISGPADGTDELYKKLNIVPAKLKAQESEESEEGDFWVDEKNSNVILSESGHEKVEQILVEMGLLTESDSLYDAHNISLMHHLLAALKAHYVYLKDQHYVVQNGEVVIVDEFTGRLMSGRRWSDGLHQAVEAKEGVAIQRENQTMASITFQNYFRMYKKLSGMTGTADTEAYEFQQIYSLETVVIPTHKPMVRQDVNDKIYMNFADKYKAIVDDIAECHKRGQPVLVGTTSVENSEVLSALLSKSKLKHEVLNAKQHAREAEIIVQAGRPFAITVATNMAGRGTDIILGGNPKPSLALVDANTNLTAEEKQKEKDKILQKWQAEHDLVLMSGGLAIIGTERHESRRIDNQLRGRSGRQGDPGLSRFYLSLEDPLLRIFGGERMKSMMQRFGMKDGESIEHKWLSRSIESAQRKVEGHNFDIRKQLLDYDNVSNDQRRVIYQQRDEILASTDLSETAKSMVEGVMGQVFDAYIPPKSMEDFWDISGLDNVLRNEYGLAFNVQKKFELDKNIDEAKVREELIKLACDSYTSRVAQFANDINLDMVNFYDQMLPGEDKTSWNVEALDQFCEQNGIAVEPSFVDYVSANPEITLTKLKTYFNTQVAELGKLQVARFERNILIQHMDHYWREHLTQLDQLRQGIHLRGYAQKDPKQEFQTESFGLFSNMLDNIKTEVVKVLLNFKVKYSGSIEREEPAFMTNPGVQFIHPGNISEAESIGNDAAVSDKSQMPGSRNASCHCGSGKKYKHCHGKLK